MKLSVFMPTIRTSLHDKWYSTLAESCNHHEFECVLVGPFDSPIADRPNVKCIKDFGSPARCAKIGLNECSNEIVFHTTDDCLYFPGVLSDEIDKLGFNDIVGIRYREGENHAGTELDQSYWYAGPSYGGFKYVRPNWMIAVHFLMWANLAKQFNLCDSYEYCNHQVHDMLFRIQSNRNVNCRLSEKEGSSASWYPETTVDHAPIHYAQTTHDQQLFYHRWHLTNGANIAVFPPVCSPEVWDRRFNRDSLPNTYEELGYVH